MFVDQPLMLNYVGPNGIVARTKMTFGPDEKDHTYEWLHHVVRMHPELIFFFTIASTDVFEEAGEFLENHPELDLDMDYPSAGLRPPPTLMEKRVVSSNRPWPFND